MSYTITVEDSNISARVDTLKVVETGSGSGRRVTSTTFATTTATTVGSPFSGCPNLVLSRRKRIEGSLILFGPPH